METKVWKRRKTYFLVIMLPVLASAFFACENASSPKNADILWYTSPAEAWRQSLPIGNGRLGAMVYGGVKEETIELNESTMWSGQFNAFQDNPFGRERMDSLRRLFSEGKLPEANAIAVQHLYGNQSSFGTHLPIGDLKIRFVDLPGSVTNYRRSLCLNDAIGRVSFSVGKVNYQREYFVSNPDNVLVVRLSSNQKKAVSTDIGLALKRKSEILTEGNQLVFSGKVDFPLHGPGGVSFEGRIVVMAENGNVETAKESIRVRNADALTLLFDLRTDYKNADYQGLCREELTVATSKSYDALKQAHIQDYAALYHRVSIGFGEDTNRDIPTDERWRVLKDGKSDTGLDALFFQYGRYLTIASSRENSPLPIALQGFFNDNKACNMGWTNDYHLDINTEQNYWASNIGNLAECNAPLFRYISDLAYYGATTAEKIYGCRGWTAHTTANVWGYTAPSGSVYWGLFPTASSWLASHLWTHYEYTQDREYLRETAYPLLKGNAQFLLDYMVEDSVSGVWLTGPSISPENSFRYKGGEYCASMMPAVDRELVYEIFTACIRSSELLGMDKSFCDSLKQVLEGLPPIRQSADGSIREWFEDYEEAHPNHRHTSHLLALYPFSQISLERTPELAEAALKTIEKRLSAPGWEDTEWSRANMICFYARLKKAQKAYESIHILKESLSRENLLTVSPGGIAGAEGDIYAFDGNTAATAGMAEMLVQTHEGYIEFLPCLPKEWKTGHFSGLCVRGGAEVSAEWKEGVLCSASLKASVDQIFRIKLPSGKACQLFLNGKRQKWPDSGDIQTLCLKSGDHLRILR